MVPRGAAARNPQLQSLQQVTLDASLLLHSILQRQKLTAATAALAASSTRSASALHSSFGNDENNEEADEHAADDGVVSNPLLDTCRGGGVDGNSVRQWQEQLQQAIPKVAPSLLLVGAALVYTAVLRHPHCILTTPSAVSMLLLAVSTSLQPRLSRKYLANVNMSKQGIALCEEIVKTMLAMLLYVFTSNSNHRGQSSSTHLLETTTQWTLASSLHVAALPAALYALQGVLTYTAYPHLDAVTFNGLSQTKTVSAAFFCWLILGLKQTTRQIASIALLVTSAIVFNNKVNKNKSNNEKNFGSPQKEKNFAGSLEWWGKGVLPCLGATAVSGLAGAFSQRGLQVVHRDPYLFTVEISVYSALCLLLSMALSSLSSSSTTSRQSTTRTTNSKNQKRNWLGSWDNRILIPVTFKAVGGILTALVHKHAGSVLKGFALVLGLVLSGLFQTAIDQEQLSMPQIAGTLLVLLSSWMHFTPTR